MSTLRPTLRTVTDDKLPNVTGATAYMMILESVKKAKGLIHGRLHTGYESCAIGEYFTTNARTTLPNSLIDEVATVNDSVPAMTNKQRKAYVAKWLRWRLGTLGMKA